MRVATVLVLVALVAPSFVLEAPSAAGDAPAGVVLATIVDADFTHGNGPTWESNEFNATASGMVTAYRQGMDARLMAPPLDLRHIAGAAAPVRSPAVPPVDDALALANVSVPSRDDITVWPSTPSAVPRPPPQNASVIAPDAPGGAPLAQLDLDHAWEFAPGDGARVEARTQGPDGSWGPWSEIAPIVPVEGAVQGVLPVRAPSTHNGRLADGEPGFVGSSNGSSTSAFDLAPFVGTIVQVSFHASSFTPIDPSGSGWAIRRVVVRAALDKPDLQAERFEGLAALLPGGSRVTPTLAVRNWAPFPVSGASVTFASDGKVATVDLPLLSPGEEVRVRPSWSLGGADVEANVSATVSWAGDADPSDNGVWADVRFANVTLPTLALREDPRSAVTDVGAPKSFIATLANVGTVEANGSVVLLARSAPGAAEREVARSPPLSLATPGEPPVEVPLSWSPRLADRGAWLVRASWSSGNAFSNDVRTFVDASPPPALDEKFARAPRSDRPYDTSSAALLDGWSFDAWDANSMLLPPAAPSPSHVLAARARDEFASGTVHAASDLEVPRGLSLVPNASLVAPLTGNVSTPPIHVTSARLVLAATCTVSCDDVTSRENVTSVDGLGDSGVEIDSANSSAKGASILVNSTTIQLANDSGVALYVLLDANADAGLRVENAPVVLSLPGGSTQLLPGGALEPYDNGTRCCALGPYTPQDLLAQGPSTQTLDATTELGHYAIERELSDLAGAPLDPAADHEIAIESRFLGRPGEVAHVQLLGAAELPPEAAPLAGSTDVLTDRAIHAPTAGWDAVTLPLGDITPWPRLRLVLDAPTGPLPDCPYIAIHASCETPNSWYVDDLRLLERPRGASTWTIVGRDDMENASSLSRWRGSWAHEGANVTSAEGRGWGVLDVGAGVPHRWQLADGALHFGETPDAATADPTWSIARTPFLDLRDLPGPELTFRTSFDFGAAENGSNAAGGAVFALLEANATRPAERVLLIPADDAYAGDVEAPAFAGLARALHGRVPVGASATAFVANATDEVVRVPLDSIVDALASRRVAFEFHAVTSRALRTTGWTIRSLRIGSPGPAHELDVASLPTFASGRAGPDVPVPVLVELRNSGLFLATNATLRVEVRNATGSVFSTSAELDANSLPKPGSARVVSTGIPWTPPEAGSFLVTASLDTFPPNDDAMAVGITTEVNVVQDRSVALALPGDATLLDTATPSTGAPLGCHVDVVDTGTLPVDVGNATLVLDVRDGGGASVLASPLRFDVATLLGRALQPGERARLSVPAAWTPSTSGAYRLHAELSLDDPAAIPGAPLEATFVVTDLMPLDLTAATPTGAGWTNASASPEPAAWTFVATAGADGSLEIPPVNLRSAESAHLMIRHAESLEDAFDGVRLEVNSPRDGAWVPITEDPGYEGTISPPSALDATSAARTYTGEGSGTDDIDLASVPELRERYQLLSELPAGAHSEWLGPTPLPGGTTWYAPPNTTTTSPTQLIEFPLHVARLGDGPLRASFPLWQALPLPGGLLSIELRAGTTIIPASPITLPRSRTWSRLDADFPDAVSRLGGSDATLVVHVDHAFANPPADLQINDRSPADDIGGADGGIAIGPPVIRAGSTAVDVGAPDNATGFAPLTDADAVSWTRTDAGWEVDATPGMDANARLIFPVDLSAAVANVTLTLDADAHLTAAFDSLRDSTVPLSTASLEASLDLGRSWSSIPVSPRGQADLSSFAGRPILLALHGAMGTHPAARRDAWLVRNVTIDADFFRGDEVKLRLHGVADGNGDVGTFALDDASLRVVRHADGGAVRLDGPLPGAPITAGYRTLDVEVVNVGSHELPATTLHVRIDDPPEANSTEPHVEDRAIDALPAGQSAHVAVRGGDTNWFLASNESRARVSLSLDPAPDESLVADDTQVVELGGPDVQASTSIEPLAFSAWPQAIDPARSDLVTILLHVANRGEDSATLAGPTVDVLGPDGNLTRTLANARPESVRLDPGQEANVTWTWRTAAGTLPPGELTLLAHVPTLTSTGTRETTISAPLFARGPFVGGFVYVEPFGLPTSLPWSCDGSSPCARLDELTFQSAPASLAVGLPPSDPTDTAPDSTVRSPPFPVEGWTGAWLRAALRYDVPAGSNATLEAAPVHADGTVGGWSNVTILRGVSRGFSRDEFEPVDVDVSSFLGADVTSLVLRVDVPRPVPGNPPVVWLDDVSVTPLHHSVDAPSPTPVADGVEKRLLAWVQNDGALADRYVLSFLDARGRAAAPPSGWTLEARDVATGELLASTSAAVTGEALVVPPGERAPVLLVVRSAATGAGSPLRGPLSFPLTVASSLLAHDNVTTALPIDAAGKPRAHLDITSIDPGATADLPPGRTRTIHVGLLNDGLATGAGALTLVALPPDGDVSAREPLAPISGSANASLDAGARADVAFAWTPGHAGAYRLAATLGAARLTADARVAPLAVPDLHVAWSLADPTNVTVGTPLHARVNVTNRGGANATGVRVTLRAGVQSLLDSDGPLVVGDLAPASSWSWAGDWTPAAVGNVQLVASAFSTTGTPEDLATLDDNVATASLFVREPSTSLVSVAPAAFKLANLGNVNDSWTLALDTPWPYALDVNGTRAGSATLPPGGWALVRALVAAPPNASADDASIALVATSASGIHARASAPLPIRPRHDLRVALVASVLDPVRPVLHARVENMGNVRETLALDAEGLPSGWTLLARNVTVAEGRASDVPLLLAAPPHAAPGSFVVSLAWATWNASGRANATVTVPTVHDLRTRLAGDDANATLRLENEGNVVERLIATSTLAGLDDHAFVISPGQASDLSTPIVDGVASVQLEGTTSAFVAAELHAPTADLRVASLAPSGDGWLATVLNDGNATSANATIALFLDGVAVDARDVAALPPGASGDVLLAWARAPGTHTLAALVQGSAAPARAITIHEPDRSPLGLDAARRATPSAGTGVLVLAALALAIARRRRS